MKHLLALFLALFAFAAQAAPFLYSEAYPATGAQPDAATVTINGGAPVTCTVQTVTAGKQPKCDLASITSPGTYTLVLTVTKAAGIVNTTGGATNDPGGSASSSPFAYVLRGSFAPTVTPTVAP